MRILLENTSCLVIDYQEKIVPAMAEKEVLLENSTKLLKGLSILGVPMVITSQYTKGLGMNLPEIFEGAGTQEYFDKISFSAFDVPEVKGKLQERGKTVIVCGIEAHVCVLQTVIDLLEDGYQPVLVTDCISSRDKQNVEIAIERAKQEGALLTTSESVLFELLRSAGHEKFKEISKLVK